MTEPVVGITGVGVHVPRYRLAVATLGAVWGASGSGTSAVANHDEDSLTHGGGGRSQRAGADRGEASISSASPARPPRTPRSPRPRCWPRSSTAGRRVSVADLGGSLRARARRARASPSTRFVPAPRGRRWSRPLTFASPRPAATSRPPGATPRRPCGWGGGWRHRAAPGRRVPHARVLRRLAPRRHAFPRAGRPDLRSRLRLRAADGRGGAAPLAETGVAAGRDQRLPCTRRTPGSRHRSSGASASARSALPAVPLLTRIGNTGVASPLLALAACLEDAEPGTAFVVGYGSGADALLFEATGAIRALTGLGRGGPGSRRPIAPAVREASQVPASRRDGAGPAPSWRCR